MRRKIEVSRPISSVRVATASLDLGCFTTVLLRHFINCDLIAFEDFWIAKRVKLINEWSDACGMKTTNALSI